MQLFTLLFIAAVAIGLFLELWLMQRQLRHVAAHRNQVPSAFAAQVTLPEHQKAADYTRAKLDIGQISLFIGTGLLLVWTLGGGIDFLNRQWQLLSGDPLWSGIGLIFSVSLISALVELPLGVWNTFVVEARFGFNRTTPRRFLGDLLLQLLLALLLGTPLLWVILWLMERAGDNWWLAAWAVWMGFMLLMLWIYPTLIAPVFNKFTPLEEGPLKQRIQGLLERCGFTSNGIFIMDGSKRSGHGNAYFTGFGKNKRIVFYDTLANSLEGSEMEAVLAHELGHFKRRHVFKQLLLSTLLSLLGFALLGWLAGQSWFYHSLGVNAQSNALALLLFMLTLPVFTQFLQPVMAILSRKHEFEADDFAVQQTGAEPMIRALVKLYRENANTLTPDPLYSAFHDSHPPAPVRVAHLSAKIESVPTTEEITE
ncbi:M48 family metallopeptidase [Sedimenticola thiotaurini]|uniref:Peptidase M48 n=1 Tax=Sedimenticola thiotaurini TaxID=1543721 RepID=A0A0F7JW28_9GAMM|nr:M48 family metallopeptidase [Sedimenticola thiotaurini]AKH19857.1 peptidase M48 [Sedimenticola thiotaurini]